MRTTEYLYDGVIVVLVPVVVLVSLAGLWFALPMNSRFTLAATRRLCGGHLRTPRPKLQVRVAVGSARAKQVPWDMV